MADTDVKIDVEDLKNDSFMNHLNSTLFVKRDYELHEYDYYWLEIIEDVLPYIDNILRNPKRFIVNEEDIVKVELSKKITVESVIHLTQHTNLIQDYNQKTGDVKPTKVLNINKEESLDTYENRFIYTLINNLRAFFEQRVEMTGANSTYQDIKDIKYEGNSKVGNEDISFSLVINSTNRSIKEANNGSDLSYVERLAKVKVQLDGFFGTELMTTLSKLHVEKVRSPIRKTNVILKNPNFRKAEELWNYIQTYVNKDKNIVDKKNYYDDGDLKDEYNQAILMTYIANKSLNSDSTKLDEVSMLSNVIDRLISNLLDSDDELTEDELKDVFIKQIKKTKLNNNNKKKVILKILKDRMDKDKSKLLDDFSLLERV